MNSSAQKFSGGHLSMCYDYWEAVQAHLLNVDRYLKEKIYTMVDQIADPKDTLRDIDEVYYRQPARWLQSYCYDYSHGMMTVYCESTVNAEAAT